MRRFAVNLYSALRILIVLPNPSVRPNGAGQANVDPSSACTLWREQFAQLRNQGIRLGSAAPDSAPSGKQWLIDFNKVCPDAQPDFCAFSTRTFLRLPLK